MLIEGFANCPGNRPCRRQEVNPTERFMASGREGFGLGQEVRK
jgi:hypothetical protein